MNRKTFDTVKKLTDKLQELTDTGTLTFESVDEKMQLKLVYEQIYQGVQVNLGCPSCVKQYLYFLQAWYEREYPIWLSKHTDASLGSNPAPQNMNPIKRKGKRKGDSTD